MSTDSSPPAKGDRIELTLVDAGDKDRCFGRLDSGIGVFVRGRGVPGDVISATVTKAKKRFLEATLDRLVTPSADRREAPCPHFGPCGGCKWQNATETMQHRIKADRIEQALKRIGGIEAPPMLPMVAGEPFGYRNKLSLQVVQKSGEQRLAFREPGSHATIAIDSCALAGEDLLDLAEHVLAVADQSAWRVDAITVRDTSIGKLGFFIEAKTAPPDEAVLKEILGTELEVRKVEEGVHVLSPPTIRERFAGFQFELPMRSFFQVNHAMAEQLSAYAIEWAGEDVGHAMDLFCGIGTFSLPLAAKARKVTALEGDRHAIRAANQSLLLNEISNVNFAVQDLNRGCDLGAIDFLIIDPPRAGMTEDLIRSILSAAPQRISYVSCDPGTFSRDIKLLLAGGYELISARPFDMFPQTDHVEVVGYLQRKA